MMLRSITLFLLFALFSFCNINNTKAAGTASGELIYEWLGNSDYRFFFKMYQDCAVTAVPDSVPLCIYNSCTNTTTSLYLQKSTTTFGVTLGLGCSNYKTTCDSPASNITGYKEYWYGGYIYTLPSQCSLWRISTYLSGRDANINNISNPTTSPFYAEITFNNLISAQNSSPYYSVKPIVYVNANQPFTYNSGAIDADQDSLVTELVHPQTGVSSCSDTSIGVTYSNNTPAISIPYNPIQTNNQFSLNAITGATTFTSTTLGKNSYAIRTKEYRNGLLIGSVTREVRVETIIPAITPSGSFTMGCGSSATTNIDTTFLCPGQSLSTCFDFKSTDPSTIFVVTDNSNISIPNANITYSNQSSDSVHITLNWTPTINNAGTNNLVFHTIDSTCRPPGILLQYTTQIPIHVWGKPNAGNDTFICPNGATYLRATGGDQYTWSVLPGGTAGSLSSTNTAVTLATPTVNTSYQLETNTGCAINKDTVTITVLPTSALTYPSINIAVSPDSNIIQGTLTTFTTSTTNCTNPFYQWTLNGTDIPNAISSTYNSDSLANNDLIACKLTCRDTCPTPKDTFSNGITIRIVNSVRSLNENKREQIALYPNPNRGEFTIDIAVDDAKNEPIYLEILNTVGQVIHKQTLTVINNHLKQNIKLDHPPNGIYILKMSISGQTNVSRFTISN